MHCLSAVLLYDVAVTSISELLGCVLSLSEELNALPPVDFFGRTQPRKSPSWLSASLYCLQCCMKFFPFAIFVPVLRLRCGYLHPSLFVYNILQSTHRSIGLRITDAGGLATEHPKNSDSTNAQQRAQRDAKKSSLHPYTVFLRCALLRSVHSLRHQSKADGNPLCCTTHTQRHNDNGCVDEQDGTTHP